MNVVGYLNGTKVKPSLYGHAPEVILVDEGDMSITVYSNANIALDATDPRGQASVFFWTKY